MHSGLWIFVLHKIPFLITFSFKIDFTDMSRLPTNKARDVFKAFWSVYFFYIKRGFKITTVHADG